jgi:3-deoxy-manno-octulosonate cytidylyltransferase (CMP-KDO synthetase)
VRDDRPRIKAGPIGLPKWLGRIAADIVVNVQGDEPEIEPETVDAMVDGWKNFQRRHGDGLHAVSAGADPNDPNLVKVVMDKDGRAIYFSRSAIPGIYAYRRDFLLKFAGWPQTPLEKIEKLEQLRALEHGAVDLCAENATGRRTALIRRSNMLILSRNTGVETHAI